MVHLNLDFVVGAGASVIGRGKADLILAVNFDAQCSEIVFQAVLRSETEFAAAGVIGECLPKLILNQRTIFCKIGASTRGWQVRRFGRRSWPQS